MTVAHHRFPRHHDIVGEMPRGSWAISGEPGFWIVVLRCPSCGWLSTLQHLTHPQHAQSRHQVTAEGVVAPSIVCPNKACSFHAWGVLHGWDAAEAQRKAEHRS